MLRLAEAENEMIERLDECARPLSAEDVQAIEAQIGVRLPDDYKAFLLRHNGGRPRPNAFPIQGLANNPFGVIQNLLWDRRSGGIMQP